MKLALGVLTYFAGSALAVCAMAADEPSKIYECRDANGNVVYLDEPCLDTPVAAPKPPAAAKAKGAAKPKAGTKPTAATKLPPATKPQRVPEAWVVVTPEAGAFRPSRGPAERARGGPADAQWATPEKTLQTFVGAVKAGDRALVLSCLTSGALADLGPDADGLPLEKLRETVGSFTGYVAEGDLGPYWSIRALRAGTRPKWIFFERTWDGAWKIGAI